MQEEPYLYHVSHDEYIGRIARQKHTFPPQATLELTDECNLRCSHCYISNNEKNKGNYTRYSVVCKILDQLADNGVIWLCFTGGEVLCRRDFFRIYRYAKHRGFIIVIFTNATLITPEVAEFFKKNPPHKIEVTIHSMSKKIFDGITGVSGSYERCLNGITLLKKAGIRVDIKSVILKSNVKDIAHVRSYAKKNGHSYRFDPIINPCSNGCKRPCTQRASAKKIVQTELTFPERRAALKRVLSISNRTNGLRKRIFNCGGGKINIVIDSQGIMRLCSLSKDFGVNVADTPVGKAIKLLKKSYSRHMKVNKKCAKCSNIYLCGWCPVVSRLEVGENAPVPYLCEVGIERRKHLSANIEA